MSVTLAQARPEVAKRCQEFLSGTATGGSTTTVVDATALTYADDYWNEATVLATSGTNDGLQRRVQTFSSSSNTLTLYSAFTAAVAAGMTYELYRRFTPTDIDLGINRALNIGAPDFREHVRSDVTAVRDTYTYAFPTDPRLLDKALVGIEYGPTPNPTTKPLARLAPELYEVTEDYVASSTNANVKTLQLKFDPTDTYTIRFVFDGSLTNVSASTDRIRLDLPELEWLYTQSCAEVWRIEASRSADANRKTAIDETARWDISADRLRRQLGMQRKQAPLRRTAFRVTGL